MSTLPPIVPTPKDEDAEHERQVKAAREQMIAEERAEGERVRALGPEPAPQITEEQLRNNPSNYVPAIDTFMAQSAEEFRMTVTTQDNPTVVQPAPKAKADDDDKRQQWVCVTSDGIRSYDNKGALHPVFGSDAHLMDHMVTCPECGSTSVRKVQPGEDLREGEAQARWTRERTSMMSPGRSLS
jgi:hypothetical protein